MRCKFRVLSITRQTGTVTKLDEAGLPAAGPDGRIQQVPGEIWTVKMAPVYADRDPKHENSLFWAYSPGGVFELNTVNRAAVEALQLDGEYYIDITPVRALVDGVQAIAVTEPVPAA